MNYTDPVTKVTILPRGRALGYTMVMPTEDRYSKTRNQLLDNLAYAMGGRVAEEVVFGDPSTGASNDISQATEIARQMVTEYGMSHQGRLRAPRGQLRRGVPGPRHGSRPRVLRGAGLRSSTPRCASSWTTPWPRPPAALDGEPQGARRARRAAAREARPSTSPSSPCSSPRSRRRPSAQGGSAGTGRPSALPRQQRKAPAPREGRAQGHSASESPRASARTAHRTR